ncbi:MAG: hypothetical protein U0736_00145 [Gemmataceae bacterium]
MTTLFAKLARLFATRKPARHARPTGFRPGLEQLDERLCLSVTVGTIDAGHTLVINGDNAANAVTIIQDDDANHLTVQAAGINQTFDSNKITNVVINLKGGADSLTWKLGGGSDFHFAKNITFQGGVGNDISSFDFHNDGNGGEAKIRANLAVTINDIGLVDADKATVVLGKVDDVNVLVKTRLGFGNDTFDGTLAGDLSDDAHVKFDLVDANNFLFIRGGNDRYTLKADNDVDIDDDAVLDINVFGGAGNDTLDFSFRGEVDGLLKVRLDGGAGNDVVKANIVLDDGSDGNLDAILFGGVGNDALTFNLTDNSDNGFVITNAVANGGLGIDSFSGTPNVVKLSI